MTLLRLLLAPILTVVRLLQDWRRDRWFRGIVRRHGGTARGRKKG
jgi:hypothetical protein